jgi:ABC-type nitrate/sulfonate/bicarbonate transport system substrate-binding protein
VRSLGSSHDQSLRQNHFTQLHEALFRQGGVVPPLWAAASGTPTRLIGVTEVPRFHGLVALPTSGLGAGGLVGRRIGLPRHTSEPVDFWRAHTWRGIVAALDVVGLDERDVTLVDLPTEAPYHLGRSSARDASLWTALEASRLQGPEVLALARGVVDAIYTYAPTGLPLIELLGADVVVSLPRSGPGSSGIGGLNVLTVSQQLLDDDLDLVVRYVGALLDAASWASKHWTQALRVFATEEGVATEWAASSFGEATSLDLVPRLEPTLLEALQIEADFLSGRGLIKGPVDVAAWADDRPLKQAREQALGLQTASPARHLAADIHELREEIA